MFTYLQHSARRISEAVGLNLAVNRATGNAFRIGAQHDAGEFLSQLFQLVETETAQSKASDPLKANFGGHMTHRIVSKVGK